MKDWPVWAKLTAALTLLYVGLFQLPHIAVGLRVIVACVQAKNWSAGLVLLLFVALSTLSLAIWLTSVWLAGRGWWTTHKAVYGFLLAYLMMGTITLPCNYTLAWINYYQFQKKVATLPADQQAAVAKMPSQKPSLTAGNFGLRLPVGQALILLVAWWLCKTDGVPVPRCSVKFGGWFEATLAAMWHP